SVIRRAARTAPAPSPRSGDPGEPTMIPARSHSLAALVLTACASVPPPEAKQPIALDGASEVLHGDHYLEYRVGTNIAAPPEKVWAIITDAAKYPEWNSTVISIDGTIAKGERVELKAKIDPKRTFGLTVSTFDPAQKLVWEDGGKAFKGVRTFTLTRRDDGTTDFT